MHYLRLKCFGYTPLLGFIGLCLMTAQAVGWVFNNPYPADEANQKVYYTSFVEQPKTLDPARSYSSNEYQFIAQIYEPLLQYDYLARPYQLVPLTAEKMPDVLFLDEQFKPVVDFAQQKIGYSVYTLYVKPGLYYQPHPALAKECGGQYCYLALPATYLADHQINVLADFDKTGTREVLADDYLYQIKRLASPAVSSPIYGLMREYIVGFAAFAQQLPPKSKRHGFVDLRRYPMTGLKKIDDHTFQITIKGEYPQFLFWLAMPFFSPIPWEADAFYAQPGMRDNNLSFAWYPIGSGPFMMAKNNPNRQIVLQKNPNYREEYFPTQGVLADVHAGYLKYAGQRIPYLDQVIYTLEKESIPRWNKFLQGYYDLSTVSSDSFDQAIEISPQGRPVLTRSMRDKHLALTQTIESTIYYFGFNFLDPIVGGDSERARRLRLAISIAVNLEEYIAIFNNGRGRAAQSPIPPGIFGHLEGEQGTNPYVYDWRDKKAVRRSLREAKQLMVEAGYPGGIDPKTGHALVLNYDVSMTGNPDEKGQLDWMRKQFAKLGIDLNVEATQYNRFQEKMRYGKAQIFYWGWHADYPDPENFLNLLYGPNSKAKFGGENATNYHNAEYDALFEQMKNRPNDVQRQQLIAKMVAILRHDAPWIWGVNSEMLTLSQQWVSTTKPNAFSYNTLKYLVMDVPLRQQLRDKWNQAVFWPLGFIALLLLVIFIPLVWMYRQKEQQTALRVKT